LELCLVFGCHAGQFVPRPRRVLARLFNVRFIAGLGDVKAPHGKRARVIIIMVTHAIARNKSGRATACQAGHNAMT
jgi:hypothetical protein